MVNTKVYGGIAWGEHPPSRHRALCLAQVTVTSGGCKATGVQWYTDPQMQVMARLVRGAVLGQGISEVTFSTSNVYADVLSGVFAEVGDVATHIDEDSHFTRVRQCLTALEKGQLSFSLGVDWSPLIRSVSHAHEGYVTNAGTEMIALALAWYGSTINKKG